MNDNKIGYKDKKYFNNLDFFRIIFTFVLVLFHLSELVKTPNWVPRGGHYVAVEFFFMLSGFLLFFENVELGTFIKKRWIRLAPVVLFQVYLMDFFIYGNPRTDMLLGAFFLDVGIRHNFYVSWFVPVLFWSSVFYFFLKN
ncbi:MAG: acyltransferase family protein, partial [Alphaproteobacteria bacterium]|nr:acyltransferase family protein [Alphaproteobacteria bacterium]